MLGGLALNTLLLLLMKLSSGYFEWQFVYYDKVNLSLADGECEIIGARHSSLNGRLIELGIFGFSGPILGAVLANHFGLLNILRIGGLLLWVPGIGLMVSAYWTNLTCQAEAGYQIWLALFVIVNLTNPALLMMLISMGDSRSIGGAVERSNFRDLLMMLYYAVAAVAQLLGTLPYLLQLHWAAAAPTDQLSVAACVTFTVCSWGLRTGPVAEGAARSRPDPNEIRGAWVIKCCKVASFTVPFATVLLTGCNRTSTEELEYFASLSSTTGSVRLLIFLLFLPLIMYCVGTAVTCVLIGGVRFICSGRLSDHSELHHRLLAGVILDILLQIGLAIMTALAAFLSQKWSASVALTVFIAVSLAEGAINALTVAGMYELLMAIATQSTRAVTIGLAVTTWGIAICLNGGLLLVYDTLPESVRGVSPAYFLRHVICLGVLILCLLQLSLLTLPLAERMRRAAQSQEQADDERLLTDPMVRDNDEGE